MAPADTGHVPDGPPQDLKEYDLEFAPHGDKVFPQASPPSRRWPSGKMTASCGGPQPVRSPVTWYPVGRRGDIDGEGQQMSVSKLDARWSTSARRAEPSRQTMV